MILLENKRHLPLTTFIAASCLIAASALVGACSGNALVDDATSSTAGSGGSGTTTTTTTGGQGAGCPSANFLDVTKFDGAGSNYPASELSVTCEGDEVVVKANGIPHYTFVATTPNDLAAQDHEFRFPLTPNYIEQTSEVALLGEIAVAVNGVPIYGPNEGAMPDPYGDPIYNDIMDVCKGHTAMGGDYHYHALLVECLTQDSTESKPSPIVAYSFDGFPIYGPYECADADCTSVIELKSSWDKTGDPTTYSWDNHACTKETCANPSGEYLDQCNGHVGPNGDYHYHATLPKKEATYTGFPYILGCYHGVATTNGGNPAGGGPTGGGMNPPDCMPGQTMMCCGDGKCNGPETAQNCPADCA